MTLIAPTVFVQIERRTSRGRQQALKAFGAEFLDAVQGLPTLKAFGQSRAYGRRLADKARELSDSTLRVLVDQRDDPRHHRCGRRDRRRRGAWRSASGGCRTG